MRDIIEVLVVVFIVLVGLTLSGALGEGEVEINAQEVSALNVFCEENGGVHHIVYTVNDVWDDFEKPIMVICNDGAGFEVPKALHEQYLRYEKPEKEVNKNLKTKVIT